MGRSISGATRAVAASAIGVRGRADQSRGVDVVSGAYRRWQMSGRRYMVADRDGRDCDITVAWNHRDQAWECYYPVAGIFSRVARFEGRECLSGRRILGVDAALALDAADDLGRRQAVRRYVFFQVGRSSGAVFRGRWSQTRRRRILLDPRSGG